MWQWLTAVELGHLKGQHPLLQEVLVTINPSMALAMVDRPFDKIVGAKKLAIIPKY